MEIENELADHEGESPKPPSFILIEPKDDRRFLPESPGVELRVPHSFPAGSSFFDLEGSAYVLVPGLGWFSGWKGKLFGPKDGIAARISRSGYEEDEAEFRRMAS